MERPERPAKDLQPVAPSSGSIPHKERVQLEPAGAALQ